MQAILLIAAALCFAVGGVFMKYSNGATKIGASAAFLALFSAGAIAQAMAMKSTSMGLVYVLVLGLEALAATAISVVYLREGFSWQRAIAILLVVVGISLLRRS